MRTAAATTTTAPTGKTRSLACGRALALLSFALALGSVAVAGFVDGVSTVGAGVGPGRTSKLETLKTNSAQTKDKKPNINPLTLKKVL